MNLKITDTYIALEDAGKSFTLFERPAIPDYQNVTARPYISSYFIEGVPIWNYLQSSAELLADLCHTDPYFGCYTLLFGRLYPLLLSSSQAKNVISYSPAADCRAHRVFQDFMSFLQEGSALTPLGQSGFSFTALRENVCHALLYCLDRCPALPVVCDAISKVKPGGLALLYTIKETLPTELNGLCMQAEKDCFASCTVYAFQVDEALMDFVLSNGTEAILLTRAEAVIKRANDLKNLVQSMLTDTPLTEDAYTIAALVLQQTEEILLSIYDYLEDDALPVHANILKEAILNHYSGVAAGHDMTSYREKLTQSSEIFFAAIEREFQSNTPS